jgi:peptidoglycan/LPS O-acetylase OafA/YrhL
MTTSQAFAPAPSPLIRAFYSGIDGLRGVAFLLVFSVHLCLPVWNVPLLKWGWVGVDLFFVLSGFLITGILYDSRPRSNYFRTFYVRRTLRIFPLFYAFWLAVLILTPVLHFQWNRYIVAMACYIGNFFIPGGYEGLHASPNAILAATTYFPKIPHILAFGHFWSLCVEEQFYLLWPGVIWLVGKRTTLLRLCMVVVLVMPFVRLFVAYRHPVWASSFGLYGSSLLRCDTLLLGAALALWLRGPSPPVASLRRYAYLALCIAPAVLAAGYLRETTHPKIVIYDQFVQTFGFTLIAIAAGGALLLAIDPDSPIQRLLHNRALSSLGKISYGLYFFHALPEVQYQYATERLKPHHLAFLVPIGAFAYSWVAASLSFRFLESPFLRLKSKVGARAETTQLPSSSSSPQAFRSHGTAERPAA